MKQTVARRPPVRRTVLREGIRYVFAFFAVATLGACAGVRPFPNVAPPVPAPEAPCQGCVTLPMSTDLAEAIAARIAELTSRGGKCREYGEVLAASLAAGRITIRPYMWRVGAQLASASATHDGDMTLAREVDSLNVGVRTVSDVLRSVEHEAAHVAFRLPSGNPASEQAADDYVRACRPN